MDWCVCLVSWLIEKKNRNVYYVARRVSTAVNAHCPPHLRYFNIICIAILRHSLVRVKLQLEVREFLVPQHISRVWSGFESVLTVNSFWLSRCSQSLLYDEWNTCEIFLINFVVFKLSLYCHWKLWHTHTTCSYSSKLLTAYCVRCIHNPFHGAVKHILNLFS